MCLADFSRQDPGAQPAASLMHLKLNLKLVILPKAQHYESYYFVNQEMHEIGMSEAVAWFKTYL